MIDLANLKWTCHICGDERPDSQIEVHTARTTLPNGVPFSVNVRYCIDRPECVVEAPQLAERMIQQVLRGREHE